MSANVSAHPSTKLAAHHASETSSVGRAGSSAATTPPYRKRLSSGSSRYTPNVSGPRSVSAPHSRGARLAREIPPPLKHKPDQQKHRNRAHPVKQLDEVLRVAGRHALVVGEGARDEHAHKRGSAKDADTPPVKLTKPEHTGKVVADQRIEELRDARERKRKIDRQAFARLHGGNVAQHGNDRGDDQVEDEQVAEPVAVNAPETMRNRGTLILVSMVISM